MAEHNFDFGTPQPQPKINQTESSPPSPPITDATESDLKLPRKREREVSLEPATPKADVLDIDVGRQESKERRTPAKKNRLNLATTEEEEDVASGSRTPSYSPPLGTSPPHEVKIRQISRGVEDLTWQNGVKNIISEDDAPQIVVESDAKAVPEIHAQAPTEVTDASNEDTKTPPEDGTDVLTPPVDDGAADGDDEVVDDQTGQALSEIGEKEKGVKRKYSARITSGNILKVEQMIEQLKRPRDDSDKDDNPRETKRPTPPPESEPTPVQSPSPAPKLTGFMAYATSSSPFATVKGQNIFSSISKTSPAAPLLSFSSPSSLSFTLGDAESSKSVNKIPEVSKASEAIPIPKLSGFESFAGSSSPFASVTRSKSPPLESKVTRGNKSPTRRVKPAAFSSYASGGVYGFHVPKRARASSPSGGSSRSSLERSSGLNVSGFNGTGDSGGEEEEEEDRSVSFGEKLRAGRDEEEEVASEEEKPKFPLAELEVITGEEDEETLYQVRGKLFSLGSQNQWKERGTGTIKLNVRRYDGNGARLVMRKEAVYTLLLNVTLFKGMRCFLAQDPRYLRFSIIEDGTTVHYNLRVASAKVAQELLEEINANIPGYP